ANDDNRSDGAGPKGNPGWYFTFSRAKFCACERDSISESRRETGIWLDDELGHDHAHGRHGGDGAWRRRWNHFAAANRTDPDCDLTDHAEGRNAGPGIGSLRQTRGPASRKQIRRSRARGGNRSTPIRWRGEKLGMDQERCPDSS